MCKNVQPKPSENRPSLWTLTSGDIALGITLFTLLYITGVGYLIWYEVSRSIADSWQETIFTGAAAVTLSAAALTVMAVIGTKTLRAMVRRLNRHEGTHSSGDRRT